MDKFYKKLIKNYFTSASFVPTSTPVNSKQLLIQRLPAKRIGKERRRRIKRNKNKKKGKSRGRSKGKKKERESASLKGRRRRKASPNLFQELPVRHPVAFDLSITTPTNNDKDSKSALAYQNC
jgi:hypothetical protein